MIDRAAPVTVLSLALLVGAAAPAAGQDEVAEANQAFAPRHFEALDYRMIGPHRAGRSTAVAGHADRPHTFYVGATGGGVWKSADDGESWTNVSDGFFEVASIGAIDVADSDPNVVYVGTGSACIRGNVSAGRGVYRSTDGGETWSHVGLPEAGQIGRIAVDPRNPDRVFAAALGHAFGPNPERGVFRSTDGGESWERVLFVNDTTGAVDLAMNPDNPRVIYAAMWRAERKPWTLIDAGREGGIWKTTDGGDTWEKLGGGLPDGLLGRIGITVSPADPDRVWALVNAADPEGGVYRSDDAGRSWERVNRERKLRQRAWYYSHVHADPADPNTVYALNTRMYRSVDGGRTFERVEVPHGDVHDLWIHPDDPDRMVVGNDGGGQVSVDAGGSWTTIYSQPTAEFYRVTVDQRFPYRVYGAQQDNSTISVPSRMPPAITPQQHWRSHGGCESGHIAVDPRNPDVTYSGCYIGELERHDASTGYAESVSAYPVLVDGVAPKDLRYRFQWNAPTLISRHDPGVLYHTSQHVHRSTDEGRTWEVISPDLTRDDESKQEIPGGPLQHDHTSVEVYNTVFALAESPHDPGTLWAGADDGLVHITRDGGGSWTEVTPEGLPAWSTVNVIEPSEHTPGKAYLAAYRYRSDDFRPYIYRTDDYGASWRSLTSGDNGIPSDHPTRVVREDPDREGLLYAGTEFGIFVSFDDGDRWQSLQLDLPVTPITDLRVHRKDLVVATQGRSFWILDDLTPLHQLTEEVAAAGLHLYRPRDAHRTRRSREGGGDREPEPPPYGALIHYGLPEGLDGPVTLEILDGSGEIVRTFRSDEAGEGGETEDSGEEPLPAEPGLNRFVWDLEYPSPELTADELVYLGYSGGPLAVPGEYRVRLAAAGQSREQPLRVLPDPRYPDVSRADLQSQFDLMVEIRDAMSRTHALIMTARDVREQVRGAASRAARGGRDASVLEALADSIATELGAVEEELIQVKAESHQDPINFPPQLDSQLGYLYRYVLQAYRAPTEAARDRFGDLTAELRGHDQEVERILTGPVARFNEALAEAGVAGVVVDRPGSGGR